MHPGDAASDASAARPSSWQQLGTVSRGVTVVLRAPVGDTAAGGRPRVTGLAGSKLHQNEQELQPYLTASHTLAVLYASQPAAHPCPWTIWSMHDV